MREKAHLLRNVFLAAAEQYSGKIRKYSDLSTQHEHFKSPRKASSCIILCKKIREALEGRHKK